jgi:hypothetical protein
MNQYSTWAEEIKAIMRDTELTCPQKVASSAINILPRGNAVMEPLGSLAPQNVSGPLPFVLPNVTGHTTGKTLYTTLAHLNEEQAKAHHIIAEHLVDHLAVHNPPQLLMLMLGQGGMGKSTLIAAITDLFVN